ncbi:MAG: caspase family protein, partial [Bacteroidales bacterium]|nr:caspase family protein [Bacteroidales bacterium]
MTLIILILMVQSSRSQSFTYKEQKELSRFDDFVMMAGYSPFRNYFAVTTGNNLLTIYNKNWEVLLEHKGNPESRAGLFAFSPDEQILAYAKYKYMNDIAIYRLPDLKVVQVLTDPKGWTYDIKISPDGKWLAACSQDKLVHIWQWDGKKYDLKYKLTDHTREVIAIDFNAASTLLLSGGNDNKICLYRISTEECKKLQEFEIKEYLKDVVFHPVKDMFIAGTAQKLHLFARQGPQFHLKTSTETGVNNKISFSPDGSYLVLGSHNSLEILKETEDSYSRYDEIYRHSDHVFGGYFSEDGKFLTSCSSDKSAIIWEIKGVRPTDRSLVVDYLGKELTNAQKQVLKKEVAEQIIKSTDKQLTMPKDEFETSAEYMVRREKLSAVILGGLQKQLEKDYHVKETGQGEVAIPLQNLVSYNADLKIYKIQFMDTEAGVEIPVDDARALKNNASKAAIRAMKSLSKDGFYNDYSDFRLIHPNGKPYKIIPVENPFIPKAKYPQGRQKEQKPDEKSPVPETDKKPATSHQLYALIFASNVYDSYNELINPVFDARTIAGELQVNFNTYAEIIENPTLNEAVGKIREYAKKLYHENDYLLIFFAGHGTYDEVFKEGYVVFRDSRAEDVAKSSYMSHSNLRTMINNIPCNHIMLVMDVCFGGTFDPLIASRSRATDIYADISDEEYLARKSKFITR